MSRIPWLRSGVCGATALALGACGGPDLPPAGPGPGEMEIGYGTRPISSVTGSTASISNEQFRGQGGPVDLVELLRGRVAGLRVIRGSGGQVMFRLRGPDSFGNVPQQPLIILDGVPVSPTYLHTALAGFTREDIRQVDVLKDVSSTAIYGMRGAGGVILITTRR